MEPLEFLRTVLPSAGHGLYCAMSGKTKKHVFVEQVEDLLPHFADWVERKHDAYFALATYETNESRKAENARYLRSFFLDLDGYESPEVAWACLRAFLKAVGLSDLGKPTLVVSGGGLHAYWPLDRDLPVDEWLPIARNFKRLCVQEKLEIDLNVPADAARILRPPGTLNFKPKYPEPQPVTHVKAGDVFDPVTFGEAIAAKLNGALFDKPSNVFNLPGARPTGASSVEMELARQQPRFFKIIEEKTAKGEGCAQLAYYHAHAQDKVEPLWRGLLTIAKFCEDGWEYAQALSAEHPYTPDELSNKWQAVKGPLKCQTFNETNPGVCHTCPHWDKPKFTTPIILGTKLAVNTESSEVTLDLPEVENTVEPQKVTIHRPEPPKGYFYGDHGGVYGTIVTKEGKKKTEHTVLVLPYAMYVTDLLNVGGLHGAQFVAEHPMGTITLDLKAKEIGSKEECIKALMEHRITAENPDYATTLHKYVWGCYNDAARERRAVNVPHHYGWQEDGSFVFAGAVFRRDKEPVRVATEDLDNVIAATKPKGSLSDWQGYIRMIIGKKLYKQLAVFLMGTAAPLMRFTSLAGMTVHCCSRKSGTGKTLSLNLVASVWGHPIDYRVGQGTSAVTIQQRLGHLHSLPLVVDEITEQTRKNPEWFANHLLSMTDGKGKERMESGTNKERVNMTAWRSVAIMTSNTRALDFLTLGRTHSSDGELYRLLEFKMPDQIEWTEDERRLRTVLEKNHGVAGYVLAQWLVDNEARLRPMVEEAIEFVHRHFAMEDHERYWEALLGASIAMARCLAESGVIKLPLPALIETFRTAVEEMRAEIAGSLVTADALLWEYIQNNYGQMITIMHNTDPKIAQFELARSNKEQDLSSGRLPIMGRVDRDKTPGWTEFLIPRPLIRKHCADRNMDYSEFITSLKKSPKAMRIEDGVRPDMLSGTKIGNLPNVARPYCLRIACRNVDLEADVPDLAVGAG